MFNIKEVQEKIKDLPFGNSEFQIRKFIASEYGKARNVRMIYLQVWEKLRTLENNKFDQALKLIELEELESKISRDLFENIWARKKAVIELEKAKFNLECANKTIADAIEELKIYHKILSEIDGHEKITREDFETEEYQYWVNRLGNTAKRQLASMGTVKEDVLESLDKMGLKVVPRQGGGVDLIEYASSGN